MWVPVPAETDLPSTSRQKAHFSDDSLQPLNLELDREVGAVLPDRDLPAALKGFSSLR